MELKFKHFEFDFKLKHRTSVSHHCLLRRTTVDLHVPVVT